MFIQLTPLNSPDKVTFKLGKISFSELVSEKWNDVELEYLTVPLTVQILDNPQFTLKHVYLLDMYSEFLRATVSIRDNNNEEISFSDYDITLFLIRKNGQLYGQFDVGRDLSKNVLMSIDDLLFASMKLYSSILHWMKDNKKQASTILPIIHNIHKNYLF